MSRQKSDFKFSNTEITIIINGIVKTSYMESEIPGNVCTSLRKGQYELQK